MQPATTAFFDRHGRPVSKLVWQQLVDCPGYTEVASDTVTTGDRLAHLRTYWVGIAESDHRLIFRTVVTFRGESGSREALMVWGWPSEPAAREGHHAVSGWLTGRQPMPPGRLTDAAAAEAPVPPTAQRPTRLAGQGR
ncbi:MAG TPA: hypothetical protein VGR21_07525 [Cryptosporangiaceae bacterium]|nr:hypothetical protein [Cryptosporangiaceae bacterium]